MRKCISASSPEGASSPIHARPEEIFSDVQRLIEYFLPLGNVRDTAGQERIRNMFPGIYGYLYPQDSHVNYDHERSGSDERGIDPAPLRLVNQIFKRGLERKILGFEREDRALFQTDEALSEDSFMAAARKFKEFKSYDPTVFAYFLVAYIYHNVAKGGLSEDRAQWAKIAGIDLLIPNKATALVLRNLHRPAARDAARDAARKTGLFENIEFFKSHPHSEVLNEFFYRMIATRGSAGQWIRGEVNYSVFEELTDWVRAHRSTLKEVFAPEEEEAVVSQRISNIFYLLDIIDTASVREGLLTDELNRQLIDFYQDFASVITPVQGTFNTNWQDIFEDRFSGLRDIIAKRRYLKDRLGRFRVERRALSESPEKLNREIDLMADRQIDRVIEYLGNYQGWYVESATSGFTPETQIKLIALSIALAQHRGVDITRPFHINYLNFMKRIARGRQEYSPVELRIVEAFLRQISLDEILFNDQLLGRFEANNIVHELSPLVALDMLIDGTKAISFELQFSTEGQHILGLVQFYQRRDTAKHRKYLIDLLDHYGIRRDKFDWVDNELSYLETMRAAQSDKAKSVEFMEGPVVIDVGPAGGAILGMVEQNKAAKGVTRIIGIDLSEEALLNLEEVRVKEGWTSTELVKGDARQLGRLLNELNIPAPNTVIFSSIFHEIFSGVEREENKFSLEPVKDILKEILRVLAPGGRIIIRDGVIPEYGDSQQILEIYGKENKEFFDDYAHNFKGRELQYQFVLEDEINQIWRMIILAKDAMEFSYTLTWGAQSFAREVQEQYGVLKRSEYLALIRQLADEAGVQIHEVAIPPGLQSYVQQGYIDNLKDKIQPFDLDGNKASLWPSNMVIVIEKSSSSPVRRREKRLKGRALAQFLRSDSDEGEDSEEMPQEEQSHGARNRASKKIIDEGGLWEAEDAKVKFLEENRNLIDWVLRKYFKDILEDYYEELWSYGEFGLLEALNRWDPSRQLFSTYAPFYIRKVIEPRAIQIRELEKMVSKDAPADERYEAEGPTLEERSFGVMPTIEQELDVMKNKKALEKALKQMPKPIHRWVLSFRFGLIGGNEQSYSQIADSLYFWNQMNKIVTRQYIKQLFFEAKASLKTVLLYGKYIKEEAKRIQQEEADQRRFVTQIKADFLEFAKRHQDRVRDNDFPAALYLASEKSGGIRIGEKFGLDLGKSYPKEEVYLQIDQRAFDKEGFVVDVYKAGVGVRIARFYVMADQFRRKEKRYFTLKMKVNETTGEVKQRYRDEEDEKRISRGIKDYFKNGMKRILPEGKFKRKVYERVKLNQGVVDMPVSDDRSLRLSGYKAYIGEDVYVRVTEKGKYWSLLEVSLAETGEKIGWHMVWLPKGADAAYSIQKINIYNLYSQSKFSKLKPFELEDIKAVFRAEVSKKYNLKSYEAIRQRLHSRARQLWEWRLSEDPRYTMGEDWHIGRELMVLDIVSSSPVEKTSEQENGFVATMDDLLEAQAIWAAGEHDQIHVYDYTIPAAPYNGDYILAAGQRAAAEYLRDFRVTDEDTARLRLTGLFQEEFLGHLRGLTFTGRLWIKPEGTIVRTGEPIVRIQATKSQLTVIRSVLNNILGFNSLIATKASRIVHAAKGKSIAEYGLRRSHGEASVAASHAAFIAGAVGTSNVMAGKLLGIPLSGTMAHSLVMSFLKQLDAFRAFVRVYLRKKPVLLIDTYDTIQGAKDVIIIADEMRALGHQLFAVRIDSGNLAQLSREVRRLFDEAGYDGKKYHKILIFVSSDLDEYKIRDLMAEGAPIDGFGVGTRMVTGGEQSILVGEFSGSNRQDDQLVEMNLADLRPQTPQELFDLRGYALRQMAEKLPGFIAPQAVLAPPLPAEVIGPSPTRALFTDFYQLSMMQVYFREGRMQEQATFDYFYRRPPAGAGYLISAGTEKVLDYLEHLRFSEEDIAYLRATGFFDEDFLAFLREFRFTGDVLGVPEGTVVFPHEPILRITAPLPQAQYVETYILNVMNFQSLIATGASQFALAAGELPFVERAHPWTQGRAHMDVSRAAFLAGARATTNLMAAKHFGIPLRRVSQEFAGTPEEILARRDELNADFGVGLQIATGWQTSAVGGVYKLADIEGRGVMKVSGDEGKMTLPGKKKSYRVIGPDGKFSKGVIGREEEDLTRELKQGEHVVPVQALMFRQGERIYSQESLTDIQRYVEDQLRRLDQRHTFAGGAQPFPMETSTGLQRDQQELVQRLLRENGTASSPVEAAGGTAPVQQDARQVDGILRAMLEKNREAITPGDVRRIETAFGPRGFAVDAREENDHLLREAAALARIGDDGLQELQEFFRRSGHLADPGKKQRPTLAMRWPQEFWELFPLKGIDRVVARKNSSNWLHLILSNSRIQGGIIPLWLKAADTDYHQVELGVGTFRKIPTRDLLGLNLPEFSRPWLDDRVVSRFTRIWFGEVLLPWLTRRGFRSLLISEIISSETRPFFLLFGARDIDHSRGMLISLDQPKSSSPVKTVDPSDFLETVRGHVKEAARLMNVSSEELAAVLQPARVVEVSIPVRMDDGGLQTFIGWRVVHRFIGKGGIRIDPELDKNVVMALALEMSVKTAVAGLPLGGAKGGIRADPAKLSSGELARLMRGYVKAVLDKVWQEYGEVAFGVAKDVPAPDAGTDSFLMGISVDEFLRWIVENEIMDVAGAAVLSGKLRKVIPTDGPATPFLDRYRGMREQGMIQAIPLAGAFTGKSPERGGLKLRNIATGLGIAYTALEYLKLKGVLVKDARMFDGQTVTVQGFGNVGQGTALSFTRLGAKVVGIAEVDDAGPYAFYKRQGFDEEDLALLTGYKKEHSTLRTFPDPRSNLDINKFWALDVDILVPAATQDQITGDNAGSVRAKYIIEGANGPTTLEAEHILKRKGIPVIPGELANAGGVIVSWFEMQENVQGRGWDDERVQEELYKIIRGNVERVLGAAGDRAVSLREAAYLLAVDKMRPSPASSPIDHAPRVASRSFGKDIVLVPMEIDWITPNFVDPSRPLIDLVFRFDEFLKGVGRARRYVRALWFESDFYNIWEKMLLKLRKKIRDLIVFNVPEDLKKAGSRVKGQVAWNNEQWPVISDERRTTRYEIRNTDFPVGAVVALSSSPMNSGSLMDETWQGYWEGKLARRDPASEKLAAELAQLASIPVACEAGQSCAEQKDFIAFVQAKANGNPDSPWAMVWGKIKSPQTGRQIAVMEGRGAEFSSRPQ